MLSESGRSLLKLEGIVISSFQPFWRGGADWLHGVIKAWSCFGCLLKWC